jgi:hypothetical protein
VSHPREPFTPSPPAHRTVNRSAPGWPDDVPKDLGAQATDPLGSAYGERANAQQLHLITPSMAAHTEIPMAARTVHPYLRDD